MGGETEQEVSGWTVDTLRQHVIVELQARDRLLEEIKANNARLLAEMDLRYQQRYDADGKALAAALLAAEKAVQTALTAAEKAVNKAETAAEKRFEAVNEFRGQLADQAASFMPRSEHAVQMEAAAERMSRFDDAIKSFSVWQGNITGRIAVAGIAFTVIMAAIVFIANYATRRS